MGRKLGRGRRPLFEEGAWSPSSTMWPGPCKAHLRAKSRLDPFSRLVTGHGPKIGEGLRPPLLWQGELGPHVTQRRLGRGLAPYQVAS